MPIHKHGKTVQCQQGRLVREKKKSLAFGEWITGTSRAVAVVIAWRRPSFLSINRRRMNMKSSIEGVQVGDRVWDCRFGWGIVRGTYAGETYPIACEFETDDVRTAKVEYTAGGRFYPSDNFPSVFFAPWCGEHGKDPYPPRPKREVEAWRWVVVLYDGTELTTRDRVSVARMNDLASSLPGSVRYEIIPGTKTMVRE